MLPFSLPCVEQKHSLFQAPRETQRRGQGERKRGGILAEPGTG